MEHSNAFVDSRNVKGGIKDFNQVLRINPNYAEGNYSQGNARFQNENLKES
ncbi:hypothetical protein FDUTEX481_08954 [Tolypothrix sp. PCC 7601]|nr:hypothetical protein FDUTEX481_08954 [Tolypothrix sp. PCC 7601]